MVSGFLSSSQDPILYRFTLTSNHHTTSDISNAEDTHLRDAELDSVHGLDPHEQPQSFQLAYIVSGIPSSNAIVFG